MHIIDQITNFALTNPGLPEAPATSNTIDIVLTFFFGLIGAISILVIVVAGFQLVISSGDPQKIAKARQTITYAVVGLVIAVLGTTIVNFVIGAVVK